MPHIHSSSYGESRLRMLRVMRLGDRHDPKDLTVALRFEGNFGAAFKDGDPGGLLPGEAIKNLVHRVARGQEHAAIEELGLAGRRAAHREREQQRHARLGDRRPRESGPDADRRVRARRARPDLGRTDG